MGALGSLADWILALAATIGAALTGLGGVVLDNRQRSKRNKRQLQGDPGDPNSRGVLEIARDNGEKIDHLEAKMEDQHEELIERVQDIHGGGD